MTIKIEKNIPMPTRAASKPRAEKYHERVAHFELAQFRVPIGAAALANHARRVAKDTGRKFLVRTVVDSAGAERGARVWRKA